MKNRYMLLLVATIVATATLDAISSSNITQAVKAAHRNFFAFNKTGRVSTQQKYGILKRAYFDLNGMKYPGSAKQYAIDKLHTQKRLFMAYSATTTAIILNECKEFCYKTYNDLMNHNYDGQNPFAAAEEAADNAILL